MELPVHGLHLQAMWDGDTSVTPEEKIAELEARQLELVNIVRDLIMELNKAYGVEA